MVVEGNAERRSTLFLLHFAYSLLQRENKEDPSRNVIEIKYCCSILCLPTPPYYHSGSSCVALVVSARQFRLPHGLTGNFHTTVQLIRLATQNAQRVKNEGRCEVPQQRCEAIRSPLHPADTIFLPRCALLHRCGEDTGCCLSDDNVCAPVETETVQLFFYSFVRTICLSRTQPQLLILQNELKYSLMHSHFNIRIQSHA